MYKENTEKYFNITKLGGGEYRHTQQGVFPTAEQALAQGPWVKGAEYGEWLTPTPRTGWICLSDERPD